MTMKSFIGILLYLPFCSGLVQSNIRRRIFSLPLVVCVNTAFMPKSDCNALDVDAFIKKELGNEEKSTTKNYSSDEALCKFGQPGKDRGDACVRAGIPIASPGKSVNAYGEIDRGSYIRCKQFYELEEEGYVKKTVCE
jgi:hypothetical protein